MHKGLKHTKAADKKWGLFPHNEENNSELV